MNTTFVARHPVDLAAVVPIVLGFQPHESLVLLTFGGRRPFHARLDLPSKREIPEAVQTLLAPAVRAGVETVALLVYSAHRNLANFAVRCAEAAFTGRGIELLEGFRIHDGALWPCAARSDIPPAGLAYDAEAHPFRAEAVLGGFVTRGSREELADSIRKDDREADAVARWVGFVEPMAPSEVAIVLDDMLVLEMDPEGWAAFLLALRSPVVGEMVWGHLHERNPRETVDFWSGVVRTCPDGLVGGPAAFLAYAAWLCGHGALAWLALDRCFEAEPQHRFGRLLAVALRQAIPPPIVGAA